MHENLRPKLADLRKAWATMKSDRLKMTGAASIQNNPAVSAACNEELAYAFLGS
jgi:hypothetical protein